MILPPQPTFEIFLAFIRYVHLIFFTAKPHAFAVRFCHFRFIFTSAQNTIHSHDLARTVPPFFRITYTAIPFYYLTCRIVYLLPPRVHIQPLYKESEDALHPCFRHGARMTASQLYVRGCVSEQMCSELYHWVKYRSMTWQLCRRHGVVSLHHHCSEPSRISRWRVTWTETSGENATKWGWKWKWNSMWLCANLICIHRVPADRAFLPAIERVEFRHVVGGELEVIQLCICDDALGGCALREGDEATQTASAFYYSHR